MNRIERITAPQDLTELLDNLDRINTSPEISLDPLPEEIEYRDEGCDLAQSCLACPFPRCVYDQPWGQIKLNKERRDREIRRSFYQEFLSVADLVKKFAVSERTIRRIIKPGPQKPLHRQSAAR